MTGLVTTAALLLATLGSLLGTPPVRRFAYARGWIDRPGGVRKQHPLPVPRVGGLVVFASFAATCGVLLLAAAFDEPLLTATRSTFLHVLIAGGVVLCVGLVDDIKGVSPLTKLAGQVVAATYLYMNGFRIAALSNPMGGDTLQLGILSLPLTLLWLVGVSNAFNLIDGLDGLAAGIALCSTTTLFLAASVNGRHEVALLAAALGGALLGFLRYNFNPASIFLGDSGSLFVGLALAAFAVRGNMKSSTAIAVAAPLLALAVPLLDTAAALVRRTLRGRPVFQPDAEHIHHHLLRSGMTPVRVAVLLYGAAAAFGILSLIAVTGRAQGLGLAVLATSAVVWIGLQQIGYQNLARLLGRPEETRRSPDYSESVRTRLETAADLTALWKRLIFSVTELGFDRLELTLARSTRVHLEAQCVELDGFPIWTRLVPAGTGETLHSWQIPLVHRGSELGLLKLSGPLAAGGSGDQRESTAEALGSGLATSLSRLIGQAQRGEPGPRVVIEQD